MSTEREQDSQEFIDLRARIKQLESAEERAKQTIEKLKSLYDSGEIGSLTSFAQGIACGINQALLWLSEPNDWQEPLLTIPGLQKLAGVADGPGEVRFEVAMARLKGGELSE